MSPRPIVWLLSLALFLTGELSFAALPNILFLLSDDLGHSDLSSYGCTDTKIPHIDSLATQGLKFMQFYSSAPECTRPAPPFSPAATTSASAALNAPLI